MADDVDNVAGTWVVVGSLMEADLVGDNSTPGDCCGTAAGRVVECDVVAVEVRASEAVVKEPLVLWELTGKRLKGLTVVDAEAF